MSRPSTPERRPNSEHREVPPAPGKSTQELKDILRAMTSKNDTDMRKKESTQQDSLKGALTGVLAKERPTPSSPGSSEPTAQSSAPPEASKTRPFEVPEQALRDVLGGG